MAGDKTADLIKDLTVTAVTHLLLAAGAGAWVGWMGLPSVLLWACAAGLSVVLTLAITRRAVSGADRLPFGTFLAIGIWLTWLYGPIGG